MDFSPLRKSFKSHGSYKHRKRNSAGAGGATSSDASFNEELPILSDEHCHHHHRRHGSYPSDRDDNLSDRPEVIVKVDGGSVYETGSDTSASSTGKNMHRELSFDMMQGNQKQPYSSTEDPPSRLIGQFLNKQKAEGGEIFLDMEMDMNELRKDRSPSTNPSPQLSKPSSREARVSFDPSVNSTNGVDREVESVRRRYKETQEGNINGHKDEDEVLRCTSNASFQRQTSRLSRLRTKSRLLDPPPNEIEMMSNGAAGRVQKSGHEVRSGILKSGITKSGMLNKAQQEEEEDDPLEGEDLPEEFKKGNLNTLTVLQWVSLIAIVAALVCSLAIPILRNLLFLRLKLWKWEVLLLVLICGRLVSGWVIRIVVFFIERNFILRKRVLYFVYGLRPSVQNCLWLGLVLLAWHYLFDERVERETKSDVLKYVTKVLVCFLVANFIWLLKTLLVKVLASSFHVSTYFDRIQDALFNQWVIETLSGPPVVEIQRNEEEIERTTEEMRKLQNAGVTVPNDLRAALFSAASRSGKGGGGMQKSFKAKSIRLSGQLSTSKHKGEKKPEESGITIDHLHKLNTKNISAWNMKRLMKIVRHGSLSTLDEQILDAGTTTDDESATEIKSEYQAKAAARKIFHNVARPGSKYIYLEDLLRFMLEDEAVKTLSFFEGASENSRISKSSLKNWVVNAFRERRALALTLNDTKTAVNKLHHMINIIVGIIVIVIWLVILEIATSKFLVFMGSQIVVVSFIFGNTAKTLFESSIFLFIIHPFDVGDRCEVDGVQFVVEEMNILTTVFLRADNQKVVYPNNILATRPIGNFYRSPDMGDAIEFCVHVSTPMEKIAVMKQRIISYIENKKDHWYPAPMVILKELEDLHRIRIAVWFRHRINHQDMGERYERRAVLVEELVKIFKELDMQYRLYPIDINVRALPPNNPSGAP